MWSPKKPVQSGGVLDICANNEVDPTIGLGGVCETSNTQTDGLTLL